MGRKKIRTCTSQGLADFNCFHRAHLLTTEAGDAALFLKNGLFLSGPVFFNSNDVCRTAFGALAAADTFAFAKKGIGFQ